MDEPAKAGRLLAIGDIHGCHVALETLLDHVRVAADDTLVVLGDVIDRGPGTRQVIDRLIRLRSECRFVLVLGNHEEMYLASLTQEDVRELWLGFGGDQTLRSYPEGAAGLPAAHVDFLRGGVDYFETDTTAFVHASPESGIPLERQTVEWLRWRKLTGEELPLASGKQAVCGHTPQKNGLPWVSDGWICIDTFAYGGQFLTCLDVTGELVYQARQSGEFRGPVRLADCQSAWAGPESKPLP